MGDASNLTKGGDGDEQERLSSFFFSNYHLLTYTTAIYSFSVEEIA
ncbi:MAG: hypothetical protein IJ565_06700 [Bacilli bacterium]|nr:hypothetical protein [Bacilli bacterium]